MKEINKSENQNVEKTLNEVKNGLANGAITKEQAEMMIKKCDILIKKNKKNLDRMEKMNEAQIKQVDAANVEREVKENYWEEELLDRLVMVDERVGYDVRITISEWFGCDLHEIDDNVYNQEGNTDHKCIYFFDEKEDILRCVAVRYNDISQAVKDLDKSYERVGNRSMWYDRRLEMDVILHGSWLIHEFEPGYCKYAEVIEKLELR